VKVYRRKDMHMKKLLLITLFALLGSVTAHAQAQSNECDPDLWNYVYTPARFSSDKKSPPKHPCVVVRGRIVKVWPRSDESDGDIHLSVKPDVMPLPAGQPHLVVEIICGDTPTKGAAIDACRRFQQARKGHPQALGRERLKSLLNEHVVITGELVTDYGHGGIKELHPVSKINQIP
jgi:hypothetical protein